MPDKSQRFRLKTRLALVIGCLALLTLVLTFFFSSQALPNQTPKRGITFQVHMGFDGRYKNGSWIPVYITLSNTGADFTGMLSITPPASLLNAEWPTALYQTNITLPAGAQKQVTLYVPLNVTMPDLSQSLNVQLLDIQGHLILTHSTSVHALHSDDLFVGLLSDRPDDFSALTGIVLLDHSATLVTEPLTANTFPTEAAALDNFNLLVLDNFTSSTLNSDQFHTLQAWIERGGTLIEVGGSSWQRSLIPLPENLLPVIVHNTSLLTHGIPSLSISGPPLPVGQSPNIQGPVLISTATLAATPLDTISTTILSTGNIPLLVQRQQGLGTLYYLAFDPTIEPLASWSGIHTFWQNLLLRSVGILLLPPNTGTPVLPANGMISVTPSLPLIGMGMEDLLYSMLPYTLPIPWPLIGLLPGYLLILGPVRLLIVHGTKRRWSWHIVLTSIIIFSCLSYALAFHEKDAAIFGNSISILQLNQNGTPAHMTTYTGIFLPDQGNFQVTVPGTTLTQALPKTLTPHDSSPQQVHIVTNTHNTTLTLDSDHNWTMHTIISEQERQINGKIIPHLTLDHGSLVGTITNTMNYSLTDSYILMAKSYIHSGPLMAHETRIIHSSFKYTTDPTDTLADQITSDNGLQAAYSLNTNIVQTKTLPDLHQETLTALSGELSSFACELNICEMNNGKSQQLFGNPIMFSDPGNDSLLLTNAPATLIGWADQEPDPANIIRVNGTAPIGTHETLLQVPLTIHQPDNSLASSHILKARLIDVQSKTVQTQSDIYLLHTGSMTFELPVPPNLNIHLQPLTISLLPYPPDGIYQLENANTSNFADVVHLQISLYNWQTHKWDITTLSQYKLFVKQQAYVGTTQRILFKLANQNTSQGIFVLGTPLVTL